MRILLKNIRFLIIPLIMMLSNVGTARDIALLNLTTNELSLKNYGFAYCLSKSNDKSLQLESGKSQGAYFQEGNYTNKAYLNIQNYIDNNVNKNPTYYQDTNMRAILPKCLDIYNQVTYNNLIKKQKIHLVR